MSLWGYEKYSLIIVIARPCRVIPEVPTYAEGPEIEDCVENSHNEQTGTSQTNGRNHAD